MNPELAERIRAARRQVTDTLLAELGPAGHWTGELSSSALSTATAVIALATVKRPDDAPLIRRGLDWLAANANADGGWGDTVRSRSNLSTTALVWAAFGATEADARSGLVVEGAVGFLTRVAGSLDRLVPAIEACYGKDRTFSVPITMALALSGRLGPDGWCRVRPLPFELAAVPRGLFGTLRLPVVSYALPALIAIGQVIHHRSGRFHPLRDAVRRRTLDVLTGLQPLNGGFLEATPLTSFVTMSLAGMGAADHLVARRGAEFLRNSIRADGSWPIDTDLATWVTTLAVKSLRHQPGALTPARRAALRSWLLAQQGQVEHPYTGAAPGGWAWTDQPGGVPDADDTAGALLALHALQDADPTTDPALRQAVAAGVRWLLGLQNRDGGVPTFCRGWGTLPFDRSTPEITAHALRAWTVWLPELAREQQTKVRAATHRALAYLARSQRQDGAWVPLWFGHEDASAQENTVYGTAQVLIALDEIRGAGPALGHVAETRARSWLLQAQHPAGGWGGAPAVPSSVEATALVLSALLNNRGAEAAAHRGADRALGHLLQAPPPAPTPRGLHFAQPGDFLGVHPLHL